MCRIYNGGGPSGKKMANVIRAMMFNHRGSGEDAVKARCEASLDPSYIRFYHRYNAAFASRHGMDSPWRDLHMIVAPTLLSWGRDDHTITLGGWHLTLKTIPDVQLHAFGHWVQWDPQRKFEQLVVDVFADSPPASPASPDPKRVAGEHSVTRSKMGSPMTTDFFIAELHAINGITSVDSIGMSFDNLSHTCLRPFGSERRAHLHTTASTAVAHPLARRGTMCREQDRLGCVMVGG